MTVPVVPNRFTPDELRLLVRAERGEPVRTDADPVGSLAGRGAVTIADDRVVVGRDLAVLLSPLCEPAWSLHTTVMRSGSATATTYFLQPDLTTRLTSDGETWELTPLLTSDLLVAVRKDHPLPPLRPGLVGGRVDADVTVLESVGDHVVEGDAAGAHDRLRAAGLDGATTDRMVAALGAPECVGSATNGSSVVAWVLDRDGAVWFAPATETTEEAVDGRTVTLGPIDGVEVLAAIGGLLPGGPDWTHLRFPVVEPRNA